MLRTTRTLLLTLGLCAGTSVSAHDTLPADWCLVSGTGPAIVANFRFSPMQLRDYRLRNEPTLNCGNRSCGIVDDWFWATRMAQDHCDGGLEGAVPATLSSRTSSTQTPVPFVSSPTDYGLIRDHHTAYSFSDGDLVGMCVICTTTTEPAIRSPTPQRIERP